MASEPLCTDIYSYQDRAHEDRHFALASTLPTCLPDTNHVRRLRLTSRGPTETESQTMADVSDVSVLPRRRVSAYPPLDAFVTSIGTWTDSRTPGSRSRLTSSTTGQAWESQLRLCQSACADDEQLGHFKPSGRRAYWESSHPTSGSPAVVE